MSVTRTRRGTAGRAAYVARTPAAGGAARSAGPTAMLAVQRSAGNSVALALLRRARKTQDEPPVSLTIPGVAEGASVSSWRIDRDGRHEAAGLTITRPIDDDSLKLERASVDGPPDATGTLVVRVLTPLGWIRRLTVTMANCMVDSYAVHDDNYESIGLTFSRARFEQGGAG
jgi:hypothetical protein